jgi:hypothetical protein
VTAGRGNQVIPVAGHQRLPPLFPKQGMAQHQTPAPGDLRDNITDPVDSIMIAYEFVARCLSQDRHLPISHIFEHGFLGFWFIR